MTGKGAPQGSRQNRHNIRDIQEAILVFVLFVNAAHESCCRWQHLIDEDKDGLFGRELDTLADNVDKLANGEVCWDQVLLLVDGSDVRLFDLLANYLWERTGVELVIRNQR